MLNLLLLAITTNADPVIVLSGNDPIELIKGAKSEGKPEFTVDFLRFRYQFVSKENQQLFLKNKEKYAVQNGGACGSMGPLSGKGNPEKFELVDGKIFLFASEGCRNSVLKNPAAYTKSLPKPPNAKNIDRERARLLFKIVRNAHGIADSKSVPAIQWEFHTPYFSNGKDLVWVDRATYINDSKYAAWWGDSTEPGFYSRSGNHFKEGTPKSFYDVSQSEQRQLRTKFLHHPVGILNLKESEIIAPLPNDQKVEKGFIIYSEDILVNVTINPTTRRISDLEFTDYYGGQIKTVVLKFANYTNEQGFWLPNTVQTQVESNKPTDPVTFDKIIINPPIPNFL